MCKCSVTSSCVCICSYQKRKKKASKAETTEPSERVLAARRKREAGRARLMELRMNSVATGKENQPTPVTDVLVL